MGTRAAKRKWRFWNMSMVKVCETYVQEVQTSICLVFVIMFRSRSHWWSGGHPRILWLLVALILQFESQRDKSVFFLAERKGTDCWGCPACVARRHNSTRVDEARKIEPSCHTNSKPEPQRLGGGSGARWHAWP